MNRFARRTHTLAATLFALTLLSMPLLMGPTVAAAQGAQAIPQDAPSGRITITGWPMVEIDGKPMRAAPGARILREDKLSVTPNMVPPRTPVRYRLDGTGQLQTIWIVSSLPQDPVKRPPSPGPRN